MSKTLKTCLIATIALYSPQLLYGQQSAASIQVGGYRVTIGGKVEAVVKELGSVFSARLYDSNSWLFEQNEQTVAKVFFENGRVTEVIKFFDFSGPEVLRSDAYLKTIKDVVEEFEVLARGKPCYPITGKEERSATYQTYQRCGPYVLSTLYSKFESGGLSAIAVIRVLQ